MVLELAHGKVAAIKAMGQHCRECAAEIAQDDFDGGTTPRRSPASSKASGARKRAIQIREEVPNAAAFNRSCAILCTLSSP
jgi:hypothetical protein